VECIQLEPEKTTSRIQYLGKSNFHYRLVGPRLKLYQATVLLNANVGFLGMNKGGRSFIEIASYLSLVTSLGSIVLGLFFVSQDRISAQSTADEAVSNSSCIKIKFLTAPASGKISFEAS
jgi:hypothetical protein